MLLKHTNYRYYAVIFFIIFLFFSHIIIAKNNSFMNQLDRLNDTLDFSEIKFFDEESKEHYLEEYEGKLILLVFWATWSSACDEEIRELEILQKDFRKLPFVVIALSQDFKNIKLVKDFLDKRDIRYLKIFYDYKNELFKKFNVIGLPTSYLIDTKGNIVGNFSSVVKWHKEEVRELLFSYIPGSFDRPKNSYKTFLLNRTNNKNKQDLPTEKENVKSVNNK